MSKQNWPQMHELVISFASVIHHHNTGLIQKLTSNPESILTHKQILNLHI